MVIIKRNSETVLMTSAVFARYQCYCVILSLLFIKRKTRIE